MRSFLALGFLALAGFSAAQEQYTIDPSTVRDSDKDYWCDQQKTQCPLICLQQPGVTTQNTEANDCDPKTLVYSCVCDNGVSPNVTEYTQTLPYFICTEWGNQCVKACSQGDNKCANACRADHPCGAQSPRKPNATSSSSVSPTASQTGGSGSSSTPLTNFDGQTVTSQPGAASTLFNAGTTTIMAISAMGVLAGFALL